MVELAIQLKQEGLELEHHYLGKLLKEIHPERINRADRQLLNTALAVFEDTTGTPNEGEDSTRLAKG